MGIVWHGNYVKYLEDGRESFGKKFGIGYLDMFANGTMTPLVKVDIDYKNLVEYGETLIVETSYENCDSAKIILNYKIYKKSDNKVAVTARTIQVFVNLQRELLLYPPTFFTDWKKSVGIL
ncbi:MAG: acyl-CoA thioesterase [Bacteroidales bacterium]|nr:acyl-CoA thioesterase [Bacteroidales bacterium]